MYYTNEKQNVNSIRKSEATNAKTLSGAKRAASKRQCFHGTVVTVEDSSGATLAYYENGRWVNV